MVNAMKGSGEVYVGVGGWNFPPWRGVFYPKGLPQAKELSYAATQLTSIEINSTFYGLQKPATFQKWHDATPDEFMFSVKAPRFVMLRKDLAAGADSIKRFLGSGLLRLGAKLGPINAEMKRLVADPVYIDSVLADGAARAQVVAAETMKAVKDIVGLVRR